jgi:hypothetical protein
MRKKATELSFIIGLFFLLVSLVLVIGHFISRSLAASMNLYSGISFLLFGIFMIAITKKE